VAEGGGRLAQALGAIPVTVEIVEYRRMLDAGRRYLAGSCSIAELNGCVACCIDAAKFWNGHRALGEVAMEWRNMVDRRWNEWGHHRDPLTEHDFLSWLAAQLSLHEDAPNCSLKRTDQSLRD
jgi:hypothetical protein